MTKLHKDVDMKHIIDRIRRVYIWLCALLLLWVVLVCGSLIWRDATSMNNPNETASQVITIGVTILFGSLLIFLWSMKLSPLLYYKRFLKEAYRGLSRELEGVIVRWDEETTFRDGLSFYALMVNVGDILEPEDERLLYWDGQLKRPEFKLGDSVRLLVHGNDIIGLEREESR